MRGLSILLFLIVVACSPSHEDLTGIKWDDWKNDRNGCLGKRASYLDSLYMQKEKLKALSEMDIVELMGRPDETELYKRNQKFYTYYVSAGPGCADQDTSAKKLIIRFNAIGLAKEIALE